MGRRSFCRLPFLMMMAVQSGCFLTLNERSQPHGEQVAPNARRPRTKEELLTVLRQECGYDVAILEDGPPAPAPSPHPVAEESGSAEAAPVAPAAAAVSAPPAPPPTDMGRRLSSVGDRIAGCSSAEFCSAVDWLGSYRTSAADAQAMPKERLDCNDHCNAHCERLSVRHGMPMYMVAYWPTDEARTGQDSWHIVAACRLGEREFLMLDNGNRATFWRGTLAEYGRSYPRRFEGWGSMDVIPHVGIARYVRPKYEGSTFAKAVLQVERRCTEEAMEQLRLAPSHQEHITGRPLLRQLLDMLARHVGEKAA